MRQCAVESIPKARENLVSGGDEIQRMSSKRDDPNKSFLVNELREIQKREIHASRTTRESYNETMARLFLPLDVDTLVQDSVWIPYVSRLARINGLPPSIWPLFFHYIAFPCVGNNQSSLKSRVACVMKHAVRHVEKSEQRSDLSKECRKYVCAFIPYLQYIASESNQSESTTEDALETIMTILEHIGHSGELPSKWNEVIHRCFKKLGAKQRAEFASRFDFLEMNVLKLSEAGTTKESTVLSEKLEKSKRKSLASSTTPVPNTVVTEQLQAHFVSSSSIASEMEIVDTKQTLQLYQECHTTNDVGRAVLKENRVAAAESRKALDDFLARPSQNLATGLCESLRNPLSLPLTPAGLLKLRSSITAGLGQDICSELCWAIILSLTKRSKQLSEAEVKANTFSSVPFLIANAAVQVNSRLTEAILSFLFCLAEAGDLKLGQSDYTNVTSILLRASDTSQLVVQSLENRSRVIGQLALSILCKNPDLTSNTPHTNSAVIGVLDSSGEKATRILAAKYLSLVSSNHGQHFEAKHLKCLALLGDDEVRDVRIYCRVAFANGLLNNKDNAGLKDSMIAAYFPHMFATQPVILSAPGGPMAAEEFTHKINGPLLKLLKGAKNVSKAAQRAILKFVECCAKATRKDSVKTCFDLSEALKLLTKSDSNLKGTATVSERLFLKVANEYDDEVLAAESLACLIKSIEKGSHGEYQASGRLLSTISNRMIRKSNSIYPQCLHVLSSIQELPQGIFNFYLLELASLRICPKLLPEERTFLQAHDLDVPRSAGALSVIASSINEYYKWGVPVSNRTARALLDRLSEQFTEEQEVLWNCFESMASAGYLFTEEQLALLFKVVPTQQVCSAWIKVIQNQGLPSSVLQHVLNTLKSTKNLKGNSLELAHCIFAATQEQSSDMIGTIMISIGVNAIQTANYDDDLSRKGRRLLMRVLETYEICDGRVRDLKHCLQKISGKLKGAVPLREHGGDGEELISYLQLLLKLTVSHPQLVTWEDVNRMATVEGMVLLNSQLDDRLKKIFELWYETAKTQNIGFQDFHVFLLLLLLQFGEEPAVLIQSLCHYIHRGGATDANNPSFVPKIIRGGTEDMLHLQMNHTHRFRVVLQENYWACQRVLEALEGTRKTGRHLENVGNSIFIAWSRAQNIQVGEACEEMLRVLVKKGWRLKSEELIDDARLLVRIEGNASLRLPTDLILVEESTHSQYSEGDKKHRVTRRAFVNEILRPAFAHFKVQDVVTKILLYLLVADIYDSLEKAGHVELTGAVLDSIMSSYRSKSFPFRQPLKFLRLIEGEAEGTGYLFLQDIQLYIKNSAFSEAKLTTDDIARDAQIFTLGLHLHRKLQCGNAERISRNGSFILASKIVSAYNGWGWGHAAKLGLGHIKSFQNYEEIFLHIEMIARFGSLKGQQSLNFSADNVMMEGPVRPHLTLKSSLDFCHTCQWVFMEENLRSVVWQRAQSYCPQFPPRPPGWKYLPTINLSSGYDVESSMPQEFNFRWSKVECLSKMNIRLKEIPDQFLLRRSAEACWQVDINIWKRYRKGAKRPDEIAKEFFELNRDAKLARGFAQGGQLVDTLTQILRGGYQNTNQETQEKANISEWSKEKVQKWAQAARDEFYSAEKLLSVPLYLSVARRAVQLAKGWKLTPTQILTAYLALHNKTDLGNKGQFFQMSTGSGKSAIIAVVAAAKALLHNLRVDIHTHNPLLAQRDAEDWSEFYDLFHLKCSHNVKENICNNAEDYTKGRKSCYAKEVQIIYGDTRQFQFDALRSEYLDLNTRAGRPYQCAIFDEVDSMCIDDAEKLTVLSSPIAGMELLQPLYHRIWDELGALNESTNLVQIQQSFFTYDGAFEFDKTTNEYNYIRGDFRVTEEELLQLVRPPSLLLEEGDKGQSLKSLGIQDRRSFLKDKLIGIIRKLIGRVEHSGRNKGSQASDSNEYESHFARFISIPNNLRLFAVSQIGMWAESALKALVLEEDKDYVIIEGKTVVPLDPNNGTTMEVSSWSNGLHQFLQIKHSLEFLPESLPVAYLSNKAMMAKYMDGELIGFSGTLKGTEDFFLRTCNIQVVHIPDLHYSCFCQFPPRITKTTKEWIHTISKSACRQTKAQRAVLIICKSISAAARLKVTIKQLPDSQVSVRNQSTSRVLLHVRSDWKEAKVGRVEEWRAQPGDVIITTLLGARGMDIKTGDIERHGGLHVILTFLFPNMRLEAQALGRTARQGNHGSAQYIVKVPNEYEHQDLAPMIIQRDSLERRYLESLEKDIFPVISSKDETFNDYREAFRSMYTKLPQNDVKSQVKLMTYGHTFSDSDWTLLDAYQEYWAIHLATTINNFSGLSTHQVGKKEARNTTHPQLLNALKQFYKPTGLQGQNEQSVDAIKPANIFQLTKSSFLPSRYAFHYYSENTFFPLMETTEEADRFFTLAIELDKNHAASAYVGLAYLALLGDKRFYLVQTQTKGYKSIAIDNLEKARDIITNELKAFQYISEASSLKRKNSQQQCQSPYEIQLYERLEVLKRYAGVVNATLEFVRDTQRPVCVTTSSNKKLESWTYAYEKVLRFPPFESSETLFDLRCHGLRWEKDVGTDHEVKDALIGIGGRRSEVTRLSWLGHKEDRKDHSGVLITLSFANQNAQKLKSLLMLKPEVILGEEPLKKFGTDGIKVGEYPENLQHAKAVDELRCVATNLRPGREIFLQLEATGVMKLLQILRSHHADDTDHSINPDAIIFLGLNKEQASSVFRALPKTKCPTVQLSLKRLSEFYANKFKPLQILHQLKQRGLSWMATFDELRKIRRKSMWILATIIIAEVTTASALFATGAGGPAVPLLAGVAVSDFFTIISSHLFRNFSWKLFGVSKIMGFCIGLGIIGAESMTASFFTAENEVKVAKAVAGINLSSVVTKFGPSGLKLLLTKVAGYIFGRLCKKERKVLITKVAETVEKFLEKEQFKMKQLLTSFRAIKGLELDDDEVFVSESLTHFFRMWAESVGNQVDWKLHKLKETVCGLLAKGATGLAIQLKASSCLLLVPLLLEACKLIMKHVEISDVTVKVCEALQEELEKYMHRFDLRYILTTFCGLTKEQVVDELSIPADAYPPFPHDILPATVGAFGSITKEQLSDARAIVNKFQSDTTDSKLVISEFSSCISNFVADHIIGLFSSLICDAIHSKPLKLAMEEYAVGNTSDSAWNDCNGDEQFIVRIPSAPQPENLKTGPTSIDRDEMENYNSESPTTLLSAWIDETKVSNTESQDEEAGSSTSPAAKFLAQVLLFCCVNGKKVRFFGEGYAVEQLGDNAKPWDHGSDKIEYKLDADRSEIMLVKVKNEEREEEWQLADDGRNISACDFLSKLVGGPRVVENVEQAMKQTSSNHSVALHRMEIIAEELLAQKLA